MPRSRIYSFFPPRRKLIGISVNLLKVCECDDLYVLHSKYLGLILTFDVESINKESDDDESINDGSANVDTDNNGASSIISFSEFSLHFVNHIVSWNSKSKSITKNSDIRDYSIQRVKQIVGPIM